MWGSEPYWGLGYDWDPDWMLTERHKELRATLIELCEQEMRANAKRSDDELKFPRRNLELLGEHGFLALTVPKEYGGLGENHVAYSMVCETIARYGCASTAMCYVMHIGAVNAIMLRATPALIDKYIRPLNSGKIGTLSYSDPETGSHFWYPISSGAERVDGGFKVRKKASWTTSAGFADFYVVQTTSPEFKGYDDLSVFVVDAEDADPALWLAGVPVKCQSLSQISTQVWLPRLFAQSGVPTRRAGTATARQASLSTIDSPVQDALPLSIDSLGLWLGALLRGVFHVELLEELGIEPHDRFRRRLAAFHDRQAQVVELLAPGVAFLVHVGVGEHVVEEDILGDAGPPGYFLAGLVRQLAIAQQEAGLERFRDRHPACWRSGTPSPSAGPSARR